MTRTLLAALLVLLLATLAWADGCIVPQAAVVKPARTPDQRALVAFDGKTETLVVETTVEGEGRDFAWVLPLPAAPRIEESTSGLLPTLELVCGPRVWARTELVPLLFLLPLGALVFYAAVRRSGAGGFIVAYLGCGVLVTLVAMIVPTMQGGAGASAVGVREISRETVGAFDTATLDATDAAALRRWLGDHGFRAPPEIDPVVDDYAKKGWVFVASKIRRDADDELVRRVHPLAFTFPTSEAVYPMRLTGAMNESLALELFVLGDNPAEAHGLRMEFCGEDICIDSLVSKEHEDVVSHSELLRRAGLSRVVTKLTGVLDRAAMSRDVSLRWTEYRSKHATFVTNFVAFAEAGARAAVAFLIVMIVAAARRRRLAPARAPLVASTLRDAGAAGAVALIVFGVSWFLQPRLPAGAHEVRRDSAGALFGNESLPTSPIRDLAAARAWAASAAAGHVNRFIDEPVREEDSPGNYTLRERDGRVELVCYESVFGQVMEDAVDLSKETVPRDR